MTRREQLERAGQWLREQRHRRGMSARELANALDIAPQSVNNWETGKNAVSDEGAAQIADVLDMPEIDVRRGLRLWVPDDESTSQTAADDEHAALIARQRQAIWDGLADDPEERDRLLADFDRELARTAELYEERMTRYREWRRRVAS